MSVYSNQRVNYRATEEALRYFLDKHRDNLMKQENERRRALKEQENGHDRNVK